jgi:hypothetical protein
MSQIRTFVLDEFEQEPRGRRLVDFWRAKEPLASPIGSFEVDLDAPPDAELLREVNELAVVVATQYDAVLELIYDHYLQFAVDRGWMKSCDVPRGLRIDQVTRYLRSRSISVRRNPEGVAHGTIFISPRWDPEHGVDLVVVNGRVLPQPA